MFYEGPRGFMLFGRLKARPQSPCAPNVLPKGPTPQATRKIPNLNPTATDPEHSFLDLTVQSTFKAPKNRLPVVRWLRVGHFGGPFGSAACYV